MAKSDDAAESKQGKDLEPVGDDAVKSKRALDESQLRAKKHNSIIPTAQIELGPSSLHEPEELKPASQAPVIKGFESAPPASTRVPESVARLSERGGSLSDSDRWTAAGALKKAVAEGDEAAVDAALANLPEVAKLAYRIAEVYSVATTGFSGPLLYARGGGAVEALLLEFEAAAKKK
ncbi:MAG: hypothetical protein H6718_22435 [Polyangiaceae bacterium]|nr:hypothetical protein [Myxococcales bacterium]MCB9588183.1 hypothetical protein [Polyangiaceae bacterium]